MQSFSIAHLKKEIHTMPHTALMDVCLKLINKKENKELLHYLLFESTDGLMPKVLKTK